MMQLVTLELSDTTMGRATEVAQRTHRPLEAILAEWIERASETADIFPLDPTVTYPIYTPFGAEATAQSLLEILRAEDDDESIDAQDHAV